MNNTAIILGANAGQADLIRAFKARGWRTVALSGRANEPGQNICDRFELVDIRDTDKVAAIAREENAGLVYSVSSDVAIAAAVRASERLNLPTYYDSAFVALLDDKSALRAKLNVANLSVVPYKVIKGLDDVVDWTAFPCVVKPTDAQGQRAVTKVSHAEDFPDAISEAIRNSPSRTGIVEAFLDGVELSCNVFVRDGKIQMEEMSERLVHDGPRIGIVKGHIVPPQHVKRSDVEQAAQLVRNVVKLLGTRDGPLYFQMIITPVGPKIVEIAPRLDGCHMWRLINVKSGQNLMDLVLDGLTGEKGDAREGGGRAEALILEFHQQPPGTPFHQADYSVAGEPIYHEFRYREGETVLPINGSLEVVGYAIRPL